PHGGRGGGPAALGGRRGGGLRGSRAVGTTWLRWSEDRGAGTIGGWPETRCDLAPFRMPPFIPSAVSASSARRPRRHGQCRGSRCSDRGRRRCPLGSPPPWATDSFGEDRAPS